MSRNPFLYHSGRAKPEPESILASFPRKRESIIIKSIEGTRSMGPRLRGDDTGIYSQRFAARILCKGAGYASSLFRFPKWGMERREAPGCSAQHPWRAWRCPPRAYGEAWLPRPAAFEAREPSNVGPGASRRSTAAPYRAPVALRRVLETTYPKASNRIVVRRWNVKPLLLPAHHADRTPAMRM